MNPLRWARRIKDYNAAKLAHCHIDPLFDYDKSMEITKKQIEFLESKIGKHRFPSANQLFPEKIIFKQAPNFHSIPLPKIFEITGGPHSEIDQHKIENYDRKIDELRQKLTGIINQLESVDKIKYYFQKPVTLRIAPDYFSRIQQPMDLKTIQLRLDMGDFYKTPEMFGHDIRQIATNARVYNESASPCYKASTTLIMKTKKFITMTFKEAGDNIASCV